MRTKTRTRGIPKTTSPLTLSEAWEPPLGGDLLLRYYAYGLHFSFSYLPVVPPFCYRCSCMDAYQWARCCDSEPITLRDSDLTRLTDTI